MLKTINRFFNKVEISRTKSEIQSAKYSLSYLINDLKAVTFYKDGNKTEVGIEYVEMIRDYGFTKEYDSYFYNNHYMRIVKLIKKHNSEFELFMPDNNEKLYSLYESMINQNEGGESLNLIIENFRKIYTYLVKMEVELL